MQEVCGVSEAPPAAQMFGNAGREHMEKYGTRPEQTTIRTTLGEAPDAGIRSPSAIVIGDVAALDFSWFEQRPLLGARVVVTSKGTRLDPGAGAWVATRTP